MKLVKTENSQQLKISKKEWKEMGRKAGWMKKSAMTIDDIYEGVLFYDPTTSLGSHKGYLTTQKYHQTTLWMMMYDDGTIQELTKGDLERIEKI